MTFRAPIVVATGNPHKVEEIGRIFASIKVPVVSLTEAAGGKNLIEPEETGDSFEENAAIKALGYADQLGLVCLADDSGLVVDALGGAPGIYSARYSAEPGLDPLPRGQRDPANNEKLMRELADVPAEQRTARFVCCMALAAPFPEGPASSRSSPHSPVGPASSRSPSRDHSHDGRFHSHYRKLPHWQAGGETYFLTFRLQTGSMSPDERRIVLDACVFWHGQRMIVLYVTVMPDHVHLLVRPVQQSNGDWPTIHSIVHSIKSFSANKINSLRGDVGAVWQHGYFDRIMRDGAESQEKLLYMQKNPVKAGLCGKPGDYPFSCAPQSPDDRLEAGPTDQENSPLDGLEARPTKSTILASVRGTFEGRIGEPGDVPRGENGFGYDPLFLVAPDFAKTSAELNPEDKNGVSHRGDAARLMAQRISNLAHPPTAQ